MKTKTIEVIIADKCDPPSDPDRVTAGSISPPDAPEAAGRSEIKGFVVECPHCHGLFYVRMSDAWQAVTCPYCGEYLGYPF